MYEIRDLLAAESSGDVYGDDDSAVVKAITTCVAPATWASAGGSGSICLVPAVKSIVITQSADVHEQISQLLADLRARLPVHEKTSSSQPTTSRESRNAPSDKSVVLRVYTLSPPDDEAATDRYVAVIRDLVEPKSWTDGSGYLRALTGKIAVRNTPAVQARVKRLLEELGAISKEGGGMFVGPTVLKPDFGAGHRLQVRPAQRNRSSLSDGRGYVVIAVLGLQHPHSRPMIEPMRQDVISRVIPCCAELWSCAS